MDPKVVNPSVQRRTNHSWSNLATTHYPMALMLIDAKFRIGMASVQELFEHLQKSPWLELMIAKYNVLYWY